MEPQEYHNLRNVEDCHFWFRSLHELVASCLKRLLSARDASIRASTSSRVALSGAKSVSRDSAGAAQHDVVHILDAGCGTGGLMSRLQALGTVEGIDASPIAIRYCKERGLKNVCVADLNTVVLPTNQYDAIISLDVLYHRGITDVRSVLQKFFNALKPGGVLFLHLPAFEALRSEHDRRVHTQHRFRLREVKQLLRDAGFRVEHGSYHITLLLPAILLVRMLRRRSGDSDLMLLPSSLNIPLLFLSRFENALSRLLPLPFGLSLYVIARKPME